MIPTAAGPDGQPRCQWCLATDRYIHYHDHEWGFPVADDRTAV
jgi:3-methyladenine DNA glycosylase